MKTSQIDAGLIAVDRREKDAMDAFLDELASATNERLFQPFTVLRVEPCEYDCDDYVPGQPLHDRFVPRASLLTGAAQSIYTQLDKCGFAPMLIAAPAHDEESEASPRHLEIRVEIS